MRSLGMNRIYRRLVVKHFGGTRNFILWFAAVLLTIYVIDSYILTQDRLTNFVNGPVDVVQMEQPTKKSDDVAKQEPKVEVPGANANQLDAKPDVKPDDRHDKQDGVVACGVKCPAGKHAYRVKSGEGRDGTPTICFKDNYAMSPEKKNGHRGINVAVIDDKTLEIVDVRFFDTYIEETALVRYLKLGIKENHILLAATQDEASFNLKEEGKNWLHAYGSSVVDKLMFRDAFAMVGQRGLTHGSAVEKYMPRDKKEFAEQAEITGCLSSPIGVLKNVEVEEQPAEVALPPGMKAGEALPQCGVSTKCDSNHFPVHVYSGKGNSEGPKICVSGKYVMAQGLNDAGRGFNIAVVDPATKSVVRVGHFDTYAEDSSNLEIFLEMLEEKQIIIAVTHDDASKKLSDHAKLLFGELGSGMIQNMKFRDVWGCVGQKGIKGFGDKEQLEFSGPASSWPKPIDKKMCVPTELVGTKIKPDPLANKNELRRKFCGKFDGYGDFCEVEHIDERLIPAPLADKSMENNPIFDVPIIVVPGLNHNAVRMQLETLLMNPGINPSMVTVMYDEKFDEPSSLAEVFKYNAQKLESSTKYVFQMHKAIEKAWELNANAKYIIVLEEEVILGPDFLNFLAQCLPAVEQDQSLVGISAWNENGFVESSDLPDLAYIAQTFPGFGFLLKKTFYEKHMKDKMSSCCMKRSWDGWQIDQLKEVEMIVPDVSRVYRRPYEGLSEQADFLTNLLNRKRTTFKEGQQKLSNAGSLHSASYTSHVESLLKDSSALETTHVEDCLQQRGLGFYIPEGTTVPLAIYFEQSTSGDYTILKQLCRCFGLFYSEGHEPRGVYKDMLRFSMKGKSMFFIGSASPFQKYMPSGYKVVSRTQS